LATVAFLWACWRNRLIDHPEVRVDRWHHLYLAIALAAGGVLLRKDWLLIVAAVIAVDDAWQHVRHVTGHPDYRSPLWHLFARLLWPLKPVQWLVGILNGVLD
jgi:hypothetical protein